MATDDPAEEPDHPPFDELKARCAAAWAKFPVKVGTRPFKAEAWEYDIAECAGNMGNNGLMTVDEAPAEGEAAEANVNPNPNPNPYLGLFELIWAYELFSR